MQFCPPNVTLTEVWVNHGVSLCFMDTVSSSILLGYIAIFGALEYYFYRKYSTPLVSPHLSRSLLFKSQIVLTLFLPLLALVRLLLQGLVLRPKVIYGYMILTSCFQSLIWPISLALVFLERRNSLPSIPTRGHGLVLLIFWTFALVLENLSFLNLRNEEWWFVSLTTLSDKLELSLFILRYSCTLVLFCVGLKSPGLVRDSQAFVSLLESTENGRTRNNTTGTTFKGVFKKIKQMGPFIWPKRAPFLQLLVFICFLLLVFGRVINLMTPIYYKHIVDSLTVTNGKLHLDFRWDLILVYIGFWFLQGGGTGGSGGLNNLRSFLWIKVQQFTTREVELHLFSHMHNLSLQWHLSRKTGEVLKIMDRGTTSANTLLSYVLFNVVPTLADVTIAIVYFVTSFNAWFGLILFVTMVLYLSITIMLTEWRTKFRRDMNLLENEAEAIAVDSLINFETVKYYGAEEYEINRYGKAVLKYQKAEWKASASLNFLNLSQSFLMTCGLLAGTLLCAHMVVTGKSGLTVGDYVLFATYTLQFYAPLNWFGTYYRMIQRSFIDMENMFDLLSVAEDVKDVPNAPDLFVSKGLVEFKDVNFSYLIEKPILKNVTFSVKPGQTIAFVGPTGSGKSTIVRLLYRLYDIQSGEICIDNQNIAMVTQQTLRRSIGVVPQDTVLFNTSIKFNIAYGKVSASDAEVEQAAAAAQIHNAILGFPNGYDTVVGERGLKLSGGEKQRVAIARTILKAPAIIMLDEATSALDTQTERNIQASLKELSQNRTSIIVAHRLSTIVHAHQICVLIDGEIKEKGTHEDLMASEGLYYNMWMSQLKQEDDILKGQGDVLIDETNDQPSSS